MYSTSLSLAAQGKPPPTAVNAAVATRPPTHLWLQLHQALPPADQVGPQHVLHRLSQRLRVLGGEVG
jgi:hypothetical protein